MWLYVYVTLENDHVIGSESSSEKHGKHVYFPQIKSQSSPFIVLWLILFFTLHVPAKDHHLITDPRCHLTHFVIWLNPLLLACNLMN